MENNLSLSIFIGVISGVVTTIIIGAFLKFWTHALIPWYEERVYKGVILNGNWKLSLIDERDNNILADMFMFIEQKGHNLKGTITVQNKHAGMSMSYYNFIGKIRDISITINYFPQSRTCMGVGTFLLKITGDGDKMAGNLIFIEKQSSNVKHSTNVVWNREK